MEQSTRAPGATVRRVSESDWARLREVRLAALADTPMAFCERYTEAAAQPESAWRARTRRTTFAAVDPGDPQGAFVGMAGLVQDGDATQADLVSVYVAPGWRGRGTLEALVDTVRDEARKRGADRLVLFVHEGNARARRAYERYGFRLTGGWLPYPNDPYAHELEMALPIIG